MYSSLPLSVISITSSLKSFDFWFHIGEQTLKDNILVLSWSKPPGGAISQERMRPMTLPKKYWHFHLSALKKKRLF